MKKRLTELTFVFTISFSLSLVHAQENAGDEETRIRKHLKAITLAMHVYVDKHKGELPPPMVANPDLPQEKRLSGFVLLLPYFGEKPSYMDDMAWKSVRISPEDAKAAKRLYESIDLKKAWDDPVNLKASKSPVNVLLLPDHASLKDDKGRYVSHFAFIRGYGGREDGAFPAKGNVMIYNAKGKGDWISDGTSATLAFGPIKTELGPWTAAGDGTSRFLYHPSESDAVPTDTAPTFGGPYDNACYFTRCDGSLVFIDLARSTPVGLRAIVTRSGKDGKLLSGNVRSYNSRNEWKKSKQ